MAQSQIVEAVTVVVGRLLGWAATALTSKLLSNQNGF